MDTIHVLAYIQSLPREERCKILGIPVNRPKGQMNPVIAEALGRTAAKADRMGYLLRAIRPMGS